MSDDARGYVKEPREIGLPDFDPVFTGRWRDFYKGVFLPDGFPGKLTDDGRVVPHPIYGSYVIGHYVRRAEVRGGAYTEAAHRVARAAVARLEPHGDAAVLWYEPSWGLSSWVSHRHYSALTQSYYAEALARTARVADDPEIADAARAVFRSLLVPKDDGGVLVRPHGGLGFEEVPTHPTSLVLNGWQSVLVNTWQYAEVVDDDEARDVVRASARTMADLLPLYDVPELTNTRYSLAGFLHARLVLDTPGTEVDDLSLEVPGDGTWTLGVGEPGTDSRWTQYSFSKDRGEGTSLVGRQLRMNLVVSRLSCPRPNVLRATVTSPAAQLVRLQLRTGRYSPLSGAPVDLEWADAGSVPVPAGETAVELPIEWRFVPLIGYPTNFMKKLDGVHQNVYHEIHCLRLELLAERTGLPQLGEWARTWRGYTDAWATSDVYAEVREANGRA